MTDTNSRLITRRQALRMFALGGLALGLGLEEVRDLAARPRLTRVHDTRLLMGTLATLTVLTDRPKAGLAAINAAFARMNRLEQLLSRFIASSQISVLNRTGALTGAAPDLVRVMARALAYGEVTHGAFDVSVEPVLAVYRDAARRGQQPDARLVEKRRALVNYRSIRQRSNMISLRRSGMAVTLDGLAKGYIIDSGADELLAHGCADVLVEAGGDLMARGMTANGGWRLGIQAPRAAAGELLGTTRVENAALATSGDYINRFDRTGDRHHILNPGTGASPVELSSVTVLAANGCEADALSTALMVLGAEDGGALVKQLPGVQALLAGKDARTYTIGGFAYTGHV
jgi:thiamine biosynthesis lipoprotein